MQSITVEIEIKDHLTPFVLEAIDDLDKMKNYTPFYLHSAIDEIRDILDQVYTQP